MTKLKQAVGKKQDRLEKKHILMYEGTFRILKKIVLLTFPLSSRGRENDMAHDHLHEGGNEIQLITREVYLKESV